EMVLADSKGPVISLAYSPDGNRVATVDSEGRLVVWSVHGGNAELRLTNTDSTTRGAEVVFSPDGKTLAHTLYEGEVVILNVANSRELLSMKIPTSDHRALAFSPDGKMLAVIVKNTVSVWTVDTGKLVWVVTGDKQALHKLAFGPDGRILAATG